MVKELENSFVPHKLAVELKEMGFNYPCFAIFDVWDSHKLTLNINAAREDRLTLFARSILAPTYDQVIDWILKRHQISVYSRPNTRKPGYYTPIVFHHITGCKSELTSTKGLTNSKIRGINNSLEFIKSKTTLGKTPLTEMELQELKQIARNLIK